MAHCCLLSTLPVKFNEVVMDRRRFTLYLLIGCLASAAVFATEQPGTLSRMERDIAMSELHATRKLLLDELNGLSEAQWNFKPAPEKWSIAEIAEHILASEQQIYQLVTEKLLKEPLQQPKHTPKDDAMLMEQLKDRSRKAQAPAELQPKGRFKTPEEFIAEFKKVRDQTIKFVETTQAPLRALYGPRYGSEEPLDAYQYLLVIAAHTQRHIEQIKEVKQDPNFPKN